MAILALDKHAAGMLIKKRREERGLTQEQVVENTTVPNNGYLSNLESGNVNVARSKHFASLAAYLHLSEDDIRAINPAAVFDNPPRRGPPIPPVVEPVAYTLPVPEALQIVIDNYGDQFPQLRNEKLIRSMIPPRMFDGDGPETSEQWLEYFLMNRKWWPEK